MSAHPVHGGGGGKRGLQGLLRGWGISQEVGLGKPGVLAFSGCDPNEAGSFLQPEGSQESQFGS